MDKISRTYSTDLHKSVPKSVTFALYTYLDTIFLTAILRFATKTLNAQYLFLKDFVSLTAPCILPEAKKFKYRYYIY